MSCRAGCHACHCDATARLRKVASNAERRGCSRTRIWGTIVRSAAVYSWQRLPSQSSLAEERRDPFRFGLSCSTSSSFCVGRERAHVLDQASGFRDSFWELSNPVAEWSGAVLVELSTGLTAVPVLNPTSPGLNHRVSSLRSKLKACYVPRKVEGTYFL